MHHTCTIILINFVWKLHVNPWVNKHEQKQSQDCHAVNKCLSAKVAMELGVIVWWGTASYHHKYWPLFSGFTVDVSLTGRSIQNLRQPNLRLGASHFAAVNLDHIWWDYKNFEIKLCLIKKSCWCFQKSICSWVSYTGDSQYSPGSHVATEETHGNSRHAK